MTAGSQIRGRGQRGATWHSPPDKGLYYSLLLRPRLPSDRLLLVTLTAGIAVVETILQAYGLVTGLKWPNDVILEGRKVAGILTESTWSGSDLTFLVVGIGLNLDWRADEFPSDLVFPATAIHQHTRRRLEPAALTGILSDRMDLWYRRLLNGRPSEMISQWCSRAMMLGQSISVLSGGIEHFGRAVGLNEQGFLLLERSDGGRETIQSGMIRFTSRS